MKILIAEDDDISRKTLSKGLQKQGYEVVETSDGDQAWQKMQETDAPKLLVLDIMMPVMDGLELCKKIRSHYTWNQPYIILLTAMSGEDNVVHGLEEAGADDYVSKPYNFNEIKARILVGQRMLQMQSSLLTEINNRENTEERLRQVNEEYERVFHGTQDAMFLVRIEGEEHFRFIRNNQAHQAATGISLEAIRNKTPEQLLGEELGRIVTQNYTSCVKAGQPISYEEDLDLPRGKRTWATTLTPVLENSQIRYIVGSSRDITERKQAEMELQRYKYLLEKSQEIAHLGSWELDLPSGRLSWSDETYRIFGLEPRKTEMTYEKFMQLVHPNDQDAVDLIYTDNIRKDKETHEIEHRIIRQDDGTIRTLFEKCYHARDESGDIIRSIGMVQDITERKRAEEQNRFLSTILENTYDSVLVTDSNFQITYINKKTEELFGYKIEEIQGYHPFFFHAEPNAQEIQQKLHETVTSGQIYFNEALQKRKDGSTFVCEFRVMPLMEDGVVYAYLGIHRDVTARKRAEEELFETKQRFEFALRATNTGLWDWNVQTGEVVFNEQWAAMVGYTLDELKPLSIQTWINLCHPEDLKESNALLEKHFKGESEIYKCEARMKHKNGNWIWILDSGKVIAWDEYKRPLRMIGTHTDITERRQMEEKLHYLATTDILTDLWNHRYIMQTVQQEFERARRYDNYFFAVLMLDIDYFKEINDHHGHDAGDKVLSYIGDLIKRELRQADIAGRYGGEEFIMILPQTDINGAYITSERLRESFYNNPLNYNYRNIYLTVSIGIAEYHQSITSADEIIKRADNALYEAKGKGRNLTVPIPRDRSQINGFN